MSADNPFEHLGAVPVDESNPFAHLGAKPVEMGAPAAAPAPVEGPSGAESTLRGVSQGATASFQDELSPWVEKALANLFGDDATKELYANKSYENLRDTYRQQNKAAEDANPGKYLLGQVAGMAPLAAVTGGESLIGDMAGNAGLSALNTAGEYSDKDLSKLPDEMIKSGLLGGATSLGIRGLNKGVGMGLNKLANTAGDLSDSFAIRSLGSRKKFIDKLIGKPGASENLANILRDEKIVTPFSSREDIAEKLGQKLEETGKGIGEIDKDAQQFIQDLQTMDPKAAQKLQVTGSGLADDLRNSIVAPMSKTPGRVGDSELLDNYLAKEFESVYGEKPVSLEQLRDFKGKIRDKVNYYGNALTKDVGPQTAFNDLSRGVENKIDGILSKIDKEHGTGELVPEYDNLMSRFGLLKQGQALVKDKLGAIKSNGFLSPTDYLAGVGGYELGQHSEGTPIGNVAKGIGLIGLNKFGKSYGNQIATTTFHHLSNALEKAPQLLGPYAAILKRAAMNGPSDLAVSHYVLQQTDPNYRQKMDELNQQGSTP